MILEGDHWQSKYPPCWESHQPRADLVLPGQPPASESRVEKGGEEPERETEHREYKEEER